MKREVIAEGINQDGDKYVLCYVRKGKLSVEFVTWVVVSNRNDYCLGHYFSSIEEGVKDLKERVDLVNGGEIDWKIPADRWNEAQVALFIELKKDKSKIGG